MRSIRAARESSVLTAEDVATLVDRLASLCAHHPVTLMYLHGAHAHGTQSRLTDLDVAAVLEPAAARSAEVRVRLLEAVQNVSGREDVDLVILNTAGPIIAHRVVRGGRLVYTRSEADRVSWEAMAIKRALDFEPYSRQYDRALLEQLAARQD